MGSSLLTYREAGGEIALGRRPLLEINIIEKNKIDDRDIFI